MKKLYSLVLMAAALLIGTNAWAATPVSTWDDLKTALQAGGEVTLSADINVTATDVATWNGIWIGSESVDGTAPSAELDLNGHNIIINSGNYQSKGVTKEQALNPFAITKGSLTIKSDSPAKIQVVKGQSIISKSTNVFSVFGANEANKVDPKGNAPFTYLEIGANVTVETQNGTVVAIDRLTVGHAAVGANKNNYATDGYAYGARIEIKGSLISQGAESTAISTDSKTGLKSYGNKCYGIKVNGLVLSPADENKMYAPYVHIHPSAVLQSDNRSGFVKVNADNVAIMAGTAAVYASGFAQWLIEGNCSGATGVYIGSGILVINNAQVKSAADEYDAAGAGGHANGSGSAIVINSRNNYPGEVAVTVTGDTKAESTSGYALEEIVNTTNNETKVENINIQGGTFEGGAQGALVVTPATATEATVNVTGGNVEGTGNIGTEGLAEYLNNQGGTHTTLIEDGGKTILVISDGPAPDVANLVSTASGSIKWQNTSVKKDTIKSDLTLTELEISEAYDQTLVINEGKKLTVGRVVLGANARIVVEAGAKFIVSGTQGIVAPVAENIVLKASETAQATFLFNPAVTSNRHPNATVQLISKSFYEGGKEVHQRFGMPTYDGNVTLSPVNPGSVITMIKTWDYAADDWSAWSNISSGVTYTDAEPFRGFMLASNNVKASPMTYELKGELVGNDDAEITYRYGWNNLANSYAAPINIKEFIGTVLKSTGTDILATIYLYKDLGDDTYTWQAVNNVTAGKKEYVVEGGVLVQKTTPSEINPMQAFLMQLRAAGTAKQAVDYEHNVYNPALGIPNGNNAPARDRIATSMMQLAIYDTEVADNLTLVESDQFSSELDNGYDAVKYGFNNGLKLYAMNNEERMEVVATDNVEGTFLGVNAAKAGTYTMTLYALNGMEYAIVDMETGKVVLAEEGSTYNFFAEAGHNDYRFQIVESAKLPTAIENTEVVSNVKGIYTITGQYVGENFNVLPKGAYIVNGVKVIK